MKRTLHIPALALLAAAAATSAQAQTAPAAAPVSGDALRVVIDRETGQLRGPTAAEVNTSNQRAAVSAMSRIGGAQSPSQPLLNKHAGGATRVRVTDDFHSHSVAVIRADGTLDTSCHDSKGAALSAMTVAKAAQPVAVLETE